MNKKSLITRLFILILFCQQGLSWAKTIPSSLVGNKQALALSATWPLTGDPVLCKEVEEGTNLLLNKMRMEPAFSPFLCDLKSLDDGGIFNSIKNNITTLMPHSPLFINLLGAETVEVMAEQIKQDQVAVLFPFDGTVKFRTEEHKNIIFFRPTYEDEISALVDYTVHSLNKKKFGVFYEDSGWGRSVLEIIKKVIQKYQANRGSVELAVEAFYPQGTVNIANAAATISAKAPTALFCIAQARPAYHFIGQILNKGLHNTVILGLSRLLPIRKTLKDSRGIRVITSAVVPDPVSSQIQIAQEYRADMKKYLPNRSPTPLSFEAYINIAILIEAIKALQFPIAMPDLLAVFRKISQINFKGLPLSYQDFCLSHDVWISPDENEPWILSKVT